MKFKSDSLNGELVTFLASDNVILHGFLVKSKKRSNKVIIHLHGLTGNFYRSFLIGPLARKFISNGYNFFSINLRGHDTVAGVKRKEGKKLKSLTIGATYEKFEDCIYDIEGAIKFVLKRGFSNIFLEGHSTGCQKITYYQSKKQDKRVKGLILLAPAEDYNYQKKLLGERFEKSVEIAKKLIKKRNVLMPNWCYDDLISAKRYWSLVNPKSNESKLFNYNLKRLNLFSKVRCPILAVFGTKEQYAVKPVKEYLRILKTNTKSPEFDGILISGANHSFENHEKELANMIVKWLK